MLVQMQRVVSADATRMRGEEAPPLNRAEASEGQAEVAEVGRKEDGRLEGREDDVSVILTRS